jgi:hypothetical protein
MTIIALRVSKSIRYTLAKDPTLMMLSWPDWRVIAVSWNSFTSPQITRPSRSILTNKQKFKGQRILAHRNQKVAMPSFPKVRRSLEAAAPMWIGPNMGRIQIICWTWHQRIRTAITRDNRTELRGTLTKIVLKVLELPIRVEFPGEIFTGWDMDRNKEL